MAHLAFLASTFKKTVQGIGQSNMLDIVIDTSDISCIVQSRGNRPASVTTRSFRRSRYLRLCFLCTCHRSRFTRHGLLNSTRTSGIDSRVWSRLTHGRPVPNVEILGGS